MIKWIFVFLLFYYYLVFCFGGEGVFIKKKLMVRPVGVEPVFFFFLFFSLSKSALFRFRASRIFKVLVMDMNTYSTTQGLYS